MTILQDYLLPELHTLQASLSLDMSSRTADQYTYYLSSLRDIIRHLPDEWQSETKSLVTRNPYSGPRDIMNQIDLEMLSKATGTGEYEVLNTVRDFASKLDLIQDQVANSLRS